MSREGGDWMCGACQHLNFKKREACHRCGYPKFGGPDPSTWPVVLPGDWFCNCGAHNFASRLNCFRCGGSKIEGSARPVIKAGDWMCNRVGCGEHNYASRLECFKCKTPRDYGL